MSHFNRVGTGKDKGMEKFLDKTLQGQIRAIEQTFECVTDEKIQMLQHPVNKTLKVAEVFPVYPDWDLWGTHYTHAVFDALPVKNVRIFALAEAIP
jgi:hypothetical protein